MQEQWTSGDSKDGHQENRERRNTMVEESLMPRVALALSMLFLLAFTSGCGGLACQGPSECVEAVRAA